MALTMSADARKGSKTLKGKMSLCVTCVEQEMFHRAPVVGWCKTEMT
ncbi:hypothetical protein cypCar_00006021 [Cyprinus carpio]|nr:hypothetical protein cypCar_00006021 [Cyprinus carpio]